MEVKEIEFENYGKCVQLSNHIIEVVVTVDFGPRIIRLGFCGEGNLLYSDLERKYRAQCPEMDDYYGKGSVFYSYGGHRPGIAPTRMPQTFYPDNEPVVYGLLPDGVCFTPPRQRENELQMKMEVMLGEGASDIMVVQSAKNISRERKSFSLMGVTLLKGGGIAVLPQNRPNDNILIPDRVLSLWANSSCRDRRFFLGDRYVTLQHGSGEPFRFGINNVLGWCAYVNRDYTLIKRYVHSSAPYPDFGCSSEIYTGTDYMALESLSPNYKVEPGEAVRHVENLALYKTGNGIHPTDEDAIARYMDLLK